MRKEGNLMPRKGENIYKRKDGRWEGRYIKCRSNTGKAIYGYVYAKNYHDVREKLHQAIVLLPLSEQLITTEIDLFATVATDWFTSIKPQIKETTQNKYTNILNNYILPVFGTQKLENITYDFIEKHCHFLLKYGGKAGNGLSSKTVIDTLSIIRSILKYAKRKGKIISCDGTDIQIKNTSLPMRIFSKTEQAQLCDYLYKNINAANIGILICLFTGLRIGEICALRWEDISITEKTISIHHTLQRIQDKTNTEKKTKVIITVPKSDCSIRTIPIPDILLNILIEYKTTSYGFVLTNHDSAFMEPRTMQNYFKKALQNSGIKNANFHTTRHTFATRCIELGFDVKSLSEILGHATVNITMNRYVHPTMDLKRENMQKLSALFNVK